MTSEPRTPTEVLVSMTSALRLVAKAANIDLDGTEIRAHLIKRDGDGSKDELLAHVNLGDLCREADELTKGGEA